MFDYSLSFYALVFVAAAVFLAEVIGGFVTCILIGLYELWLRRTRR